MINNNKKNFKNKSGINNYKKNKKFFKVSNNFVLVIEEFIVQKKDLKNYIKSRRTYKILGI